MSNGALHRHQLLSSPSSVCLCSMHHKAVGLLLLFLHSFCCQNITGQCDGCVDCSGQQMFLAGRGRAGC